MVSIIMPAYNAEKTIRQSIGSVINQTFKEWELIVIDDGSKDNTVSIIQEYLSDKRIKLLINPKNMGVAETRNKGISISKYEYIAFLDSDDIWDIDKLAKQIQFMKKKEIGFSFTSVKYINNFGDQFPGVYNAPKMVNYKKLLRNNVISLSTVIIEKKYISGIKMMRSDLHEDYLFWLMILKKFDINAYGLSDYLLTYRISKNSKSGSKLKSFNMTYGVFRELRVGVIKSFLYTISHLYKAFFKHYRIKKG